MPVTMAQPGDVSTIVRITGNDKTRAHLHELGLVENDSVIVIAKTGGNVILKVKDCRIALDMSMAGRIMVR